MSAAGPVRAVLFDLDGTLIDSAPDLAGAANDLRQSRGLTVLPMGALRPWVGTGARGMVKAAFDVTPEHPEFEALRDEFLARYEQRMTELTSVFDAMRPVLRSLAERALPWGIVTNKATRFAAPLSKALGLEAEAGALVCGDTTPHAKPHPAPLLEAARRLGVPPGDCMYVGDDLRDMQAGAAAGMRTVVAAWGYLGVGEPVERWGADHIAATPADVLKYLDLA